jgi:hypothetical protein
MVGCLVVLQVKKNWKMGCKNKTGNIDPLLTQHVYSDNISFEQPCPVNASVAAEFGHRGSEESSRGTPPFDISMPNSMKNTFSRDG